LGATTHLTRASRGQAWNSRNRHAGIHPYMSFRLLASVSALLLFGKIENTNEKNIPGEWQVWCYMKGEIFNNDVRTLSSIQ
jgi:hypothetical protein